MSTIILLLQMFIAVWLLWRLVVVPVVYTVMGLRDGGKISRAWARNLFDLIWMPALISAVLMIRVF